MGTQLPLPKKEAQPPNFRPISNVAKWLAGSRCHSVQGRPRPWPYCVRWGPSSPPSPKWHIPTPNFRRMSIVAKRSPISATAEYLSVFKHTFQSYSKCLCNLIKVVHCTSLCDYFLCIFCVSCVVFLFQIISICCYCISVCYGRPM